MAKMKLNGETFYIIWENKDYFFTAPEPDMNYTNIIDKNNPDILVIAEVPTGSLQAQLDHKFYKDAEAFREEIKMDTLRKAAVKYPEPFNPASWTIEQLAKHAMAENYDQQNYIYGMYEKLVEQEKEIKRLKKEIEGKTKLLQVFAKPQLSPFEEAEANFWKAIKPPYADLDD